MHQLSKCNANLLRRPAVVSHARHARCVHVPLAFKKDERSGIHDPAGPAGHWGRGDAKGNLEAAAQEEQFRMQAAVEAGHEIRSEQHRHCHVAGHVSGKPNAEEQLRALSAELDDEKADEEYSHMGRVEKWAMEAKNLLYSWLKTGVEPL